MMPLTQGAAGLVYISAVTSVSSTVSNFSISSVASGQFVTSVNQYTSGMLANQYNMSGLTYLGTPAASSVSWYQSAVDNYYQQVQAQVGHMQNQIAYHPHPEPPPHVHAARVVGARARKLLMSALSPAQRRTYEDKRYFDVQVAGKVYRIHQGTHGNVRELGPNGREQYLWCAQPDHVPAEDAMLAQMLLLRHDEAAFRRVANRRPI